MPEPLDPTLSALLLAAATEPWETWYPESRLVLADLLEERGRVYATALVRSLEVRSAARDRWYLLPLDTDDLIYIYYPTLGRARRAVRVRVLNLFASGVILCQPHTLAWMPEDRVTVQSLILELLADSIRLRQAGKDDERDHLLEHYHSLKGE